MHPRPGEIWIADLGISAKTRPVVIVSPYDPALLAWWSCSFRSRLRTAQARRLIQSVVRSPMRSICGDHASHAKSSI
jgi:mRNA interferase MazF